MQRRNQRLQLMWALCLGVLRPPMTMARSRPLRWSLQAAQQVGADVGIVTFVLSGLSIMLFALPSTDSRGSTRGQPAGNRSRTTLPAEGGTNAAGTAGTQQRHAHPTTASIPCVFQNRCVTNCIYQHRDGECNFHVPPNCVQGTSPRARRAAPPLPTKAMLLQAPQVGPCRPSHPAAPLVSRQMAAETM